LHDSAGQYLAALLMNLDTLIGNASDANPAMRLKLSESLELANQCSAEIRTLSYLLHPPLLEDSGFGPAVRWLVEGYSKRSGIHVSIEIPPELGRLKADVELALFRVVQESLTNIHRHSHSKTASIRMAVLEDTAVLEIRDQGVGIPPQKLDSVARASGVGIAGMSERLRDLGGSLQISSDSDGTAVMVSIPLKS
jgi:two-component system, NarL family, sensor kinase